MNIFGANAGHGSDRRADRPANFVVSWRTTIAAPSWHATRRFSTIEQLLFVARISARFVQSASQHRCVIASTNVLCVKHERSVSLSNGAATLLQQKKLPMMAL